MGFVAGPGARATDNLGGLSRGGLAVGGIPSTRAIRAAVVASGGSANDVRGPTRRPTFVAAAPPQRQIPARVSPPIVRGGTMVNVGTMNQKGFTLSDRPQTGIVYGGTAQTRPVMRRAFRALSDDQRHMVRQAVLHDANGIALDDSAELGDDDLAGLSLKKLVKGATNAVKGVGHAVGNAVTSKVGQTLIGGTLALTGVGIPVAAAVAGGAQALGGTIKSGGGLKAATRGAVIGTAEGAAAGVAGKLLSAKAPNVVAKSRSVVNKISGGKLFKTAGMAGKDAASLAASTAGKVAGAAVAGGAALIATGAEVLKPKLTDSGIEIAGPQVAELPMMRRQNPAPDSRARPFTKKRVAEETLKAGRKGKEKADQGADVLNAVNARISDLEGALGKAKDAGDAAGFDKISAMLDQAQQKLAQTSSVVSTGANTLSAAGNAVEGASIGATAGAGASSLIDWVKANKGLAIGIGVVGVGGAIALISGRNSGRSAPRRAPHRRAAVA